MRQAMRVNKQNLKNEATPKNGTPKNGMFLKTIKK